MHLTRFCSVPNAGPILFSVGKSSFRAFRTCFHGAIAEHGAVITFNWSIYLASTYETQQYRLCWRGRD